MIAGINITFTEEDIEVLYSALTHLEIAVRQRLTAIEYIKDKLEEKKSDNSN